MLYPKNQEPLTEELFQNPTSEYRGTPFWAWNCQMTEEKITTIVDALKDMGMGGGHIHCRTGMNNPYMSQEFLDLVKDAHKKFKDRQMITWLYDEDRWPSGAGGGLVTKDPEYRIRFLVFSPKPLEDVPESNLSSSGQAVRSENRRLLARYQVVLEEGWLKDYKRLEEGEAVSPEACEWFAYLEISGNNPWFNNQSYVNTLDKKAIQRFIEVTHEAYYKELGEEFGKSIPAIFTDEPQFCHKTRLNYAADQMEVIIPYTDDLEETFTETYGHSLLDSLPELFWERQEEMVSQIRYQYHDHICERFASAFADTIGTWCKEHNLMLTGHMMEEPTLKSQTAALGEAMRSYRSFQLPGIDMLCDSRELSTAKQAQSASHQFGCPGVLSELYGVTNWDFDFRGHKLQGDWQAALGVTVRVHHLTWTSMVGEAKRDYPACIGYQSPWYKEYKYVEDYFARLNTLLTRGKAEVKVGVIHPIESYWLYWGSEEKTGGIREEMDENFQNLIQWLLYGFQDFDFISESLLPQQNDLEEITDGGAFPVGEMRYQILLVPNCVTLRESTLKRLQAWKEKGGTVIFTGELPRYVDAVASKKAEDFAKDCLCIPFSKNSILSALEPARTVEVRSENGLMAENLIYQMREDEESKIFFLAHVNRMETPDLPTKEKIVLRLKGTYRPVLYDALRGTKEELSCEWKDGFTLIERAVFDHDSLLLRLYSEKAETEGETNRKNEVAVPVPKEILAPDRVPVQFSEPNVMVLDQAEYAFDDGEWMPREELLRIDNKFRSILGYPLRMEAFAQPWLDQTEEEVRHHLRLRFIFESEETIEGTLLALENSGTVITFNGERIPEDVMGWYTDEDIQCRALGTVQMGKNELIVEIPYRKKENIENLFLLGNFGVTVSGRNAVLTAPVSELAFGDITRQKLPFYGGNIEYQIPLEMEANGKVCLETTKFRVPLLSVCVDDGENKKIAFSPYIAEFPVKKGKHLIKLTAYGNRINTFGTLHNCNEKEFWCGPNAWRTTEASWAYEYQLKPVGILKAPVLYVTYDKV